MSLTSILKNVPKLRIHNKYGIFYTMVSRNLGAGAYLQHMNIESRGYKMNSITSHARQAHQPQAPALYMQKAHKFSMANKSQGPPPIPPKLPRNHPEKGDLVYVGPLRDLVKLVKVFSFSTSLLLVSLLPSMWLTSKMSTAMFGAVFGTGGVIMVVTPFLIHYIAKNYVTHMYYDKNKNQFHATTYNFFLRPKQLQFSPKEAEICYDESVFKTAEVHGKSIFVDQSGFLDQDYYVKFMKYDEPFDLLSETEKVKKYLEEKKKREEEERNQQEKMRESG